ncbi:MAG: glycosyltransferase family 39 protein, partial [Curtobacterium sp.]
MAALGPVLVGLVAFLVAVIGSWVPSVWYDEAATVTSATRSWAALGREVQHVDLVHASYYALMHVWFGLVGYTPFTLRLPSAIAVGVTAALVVILGRRLAGARLGIIAGLLFAILPRVTWMGAEGRSFAIGTLLATLSTLLLLVAVDRTAAKRHGWIWWAVYGAVSLLGCAVFLYLILVPIGHFLTLLALRRIRHEASPVPLAAWGVTTAVVLIGAVPLAVLSSAQSAQISWIRHISAHTVEEFLVTQFSYENTGFAVLLWVLAGCGLVAAVTVERLRPVLAVAVPWVFVPTLALIAASVVTHPLYSPRYVAFAAPAAALLMAVPLAAVPRRWCRPAAVVVVLLAVGLSAPSWAAQRTVTAKDDSAWNQVAALVQRQRLGEPDGARDAVLFGPVQRHPKATSRIIADTYPAAFAGLHDPLLIEPAGAGDGLWETQQPLRDAGRAVGDATTVWLVTATKPDDRATAAASLRPAGFHRTQ